MITLCILAVAVSYICYRMAFYISDKEKAENAARALPPGKAYLPYHGLMTGWQKEVETFDCEEVSVVSFDGLTLWGRYYERFPGGITELMFHGYRGSARRDLCGGVQRAFALGHNVLIVDQRASGKSDGNTITFGICERKDCLSWVEFMRKRFGVDRKIILTGISMGAATVLMAAGEPLPENVMGVLADCGYSSAKDIICKVIKDMGIPPKPVYPFVKLGARLFGRFDPDETSPLDAIKRCKVPVIFFHGEADDFVPCDMSRGVYEACPTRKRLVTVPGAGHGLAFPKDQEGYLKALKEFYE